MMSMAVEDEPVVESIPLPRDEIALDDLVMAEAEALIESAAMLSEAAEPEVSPYQQWNDEDCYRTNEIIMNGDRLYVCVLPAGKMCTEFGTFHVSEWKEIEKWVNSKHYKYNDHILLHRCVYKRNINKIKRSVNYAIFDAREWSRV